MDQYIGRLLDNRYEILEIIGTGGMAVVYKARCHRLNRLVAIKILKDEFARDEEFRRRFHAEGEAVAMLGHPNIVQVYDVSSSDNANFIVMELIDGITLKQYMEKKGVLNWKETLHFGMQIAKALEHAHSRSIVHRDIKPHNVMVLKNGSVKVTDFGIARVMSKSNTLTKEALGSVHYISPEQAKGGWVDNRSDLYSLGVVMYEMMAGRPPYDGESPVAVAIQHINGGAPMPSTLNPNIPGGLEQIIMKAMALDTKDRYASATEMLKDMDEFRKDPSILFVFPSHGISDETKVLKTPSASEIQAAAAKQQQQPRTTAERVAGTAAGAAGAAAAAAAAAARQQRNTGSMPRTASNGNGGAARTASGTNSSAARSASANGARPASGSSARPANGTNGTRPASSNAPRAAGSAGAARTGGSEAVRRAEANRKTREEIREEIREEERNRVATIAVIACSAIAILAIVVFLIALFNGKLIGGNEKVTVPNFVGDYYETLGHQEGLELKINKQTYDEDVEAGIIMEQNPVAGEEVAQGTIIWLTISMGPEPEVKTMENLVGQDVNTAVEFLKGQGMNPLPYDELSDDVEEGKVIRTDPEAGSELEEGQTVKVYYSAGPVIKKEKMLNVVGKQYNVAYNQLYDLGFTLIEYEYEESDEKEGVVIDQSVPAGVETDVTTTITLTISEGPKKIKMINVVGQQYDAAYDNLTEMGFTNVTPKYLESNREAGEVIEQSVTKGTEVTAGYSIVLTVSTGPKATEAPTQAPTNPPVKEVTRTVTFQLPTDRTEEYVLSLYQDGSQVIEPTVIKVGTTSITASLTGSGVEYYDLYINDEYYKTEKVDFS